MSIPSEAVEAVARAWTASMKCAGEPVLWDESTEWFKASVLADAEVAIRAYTSWLTSKGMAVVPVEPTKEMLRAGSMDLHGEPDDIIGDAKGVWRAMVCAIWGPVGWQSIDTARRDGTRILGRRTEADRYTGRLRYLKRITWWGKTSHVPLYGWNHGRGEDVDLWEPEHWKPLPSLPTDEAAARPASAVPGANEEGASP